MCHDDEYERASSVLGQPVYELTTPALVLRRNIAVSNIAIMSDFIHQAAPKLRPHVKAHKSPQLAWLQIDAGAQGVTVATVLEALAMANAGIDDILIANQVVGHRKINLITETIAQGASITVAVDNPGNVQALAEAASRRELEIPIVIEVDIGMERAGVRDSDEAVSLAQLAANTPGVSVVGVCGYEGHCLRVPDTAARHEEAIAAVSRLGEVVERLRGEGHEVSIVSAGGTGTYQITAYSEDITEIQAGTYALMDTFHARFAREFAPAVTVAATVISRHRDTVVMDAGRKSISTEAGVPVILGTGIEPRYMAEEHALFDMQEAISELRVGDVVELVPGYTPSTVNMHAAYHVVDGATVTEVWPVVARSGSRPAGELTTST